MITSPVKTTLALTVLLLTAAASSYAVDPEPPGLGLSTGSDEARKILTKAQETMAGFKTFKADILDTSETSKTKTKTVLYQRNNPDGVMEMRMDSEDELGGTKYSGVKLVSTFIVNREGQWELTSTTAIKMEFQKALMMSAQQGMVGVKKQELKPGSYSLSETVLNGKSYWVVKEVISDETSQKVREMLENNPQMKELRKKVPKKPISIPKLTLYRIGKEDGILYSTQKYDDKGNKLSDVTYEHVQINLPLAEDAFAIPKNLKIKIAKTRDDYVRMMDE